MISLLPITVVFVVQLRMADLIPKMFCVSAKKKKNKPKQQTTLALQDVFAK